MYCEDRISALHDDLLLKILSEIPTKDAVTTMVLSKRWGLVWTMLTTLEYKDTRKGGRKKFRCFIDKFLQLHKAHVLERLRIQIDHYHLSNHTNERKCVLSNHTNERKCVSYALEHYVRELAIRLPLYHGIKGKQQILFLPRNVCTSKTLVKLTLKGHRLVVDVPSLPCLPSLQTLVLICVMYKGQNSHVRLLENCPALSYLEVLRDRSDNVTRFIVRVPSLKIFTYSKISYIRGSGTSSLVLDSPGLRHLSLSDPFRDHVSIQNMPHLEMADVYYPNGKTLRSFSSVRILHLSLGDVACSSAISFPRLVKFEVNICDSKSSKSSLELLMLFLHNSPILKELTIIIDGVGNKPSKNLPVSWNQQSPVPGCLLSHLEIFVWVDYKRRRHERDFVAYILANSKCLKTARVSPKGFYSVEEKEKMVEEFNSMYRVSVSSQLKIHSID